MSAYAKERALDRIKDLAGAGLDVAGFFAEANRALVSAIPSGIEAQPDPLWHTLDPASLLMTSIYMDGACAIEDFGVDDQVEWEYFADDFNKAGDVSRNPRGVQTLHEATDGEPSRSWAYRELMVPAGMEQEALVALRDRSGENWGTVRLVRATGEPEFESDELDFLTTVAPHLAEGVRRGLLVGEATEPEGPDAPGLVVLDRHLTVDSLTPGVERWLSELPGDWDTNGNLPPSVLSVAAQAVHSRDRDGTGPATAMFKSNQGRWIALHGAALMAHSGQKAAVIIEPAHSDRINPLLMSIYGFTPREQQVTRHVLRGDSTTQITAALGLSPHTVQEHLKNIFDKTGVRSRRDLVGQVFFNHYDPRVRDNVERVTVSQPIRGGPWPTEPREA